MIEKKSLGLEEARKIVEAALEAVLRGDVAGGRPMSIAVVDDAGDLIYFARMDGAVRNSVILAQNKAYTAILWQNDTEGLESFFKDDKENVDISWFGDPRNAPIHGGVCIKSSDGSIVGAIGVAGTDDVAVALIGAKAVQV